MYSENGFTAQGNPDLKAKAPFVLLLWSTHVRPGRTCSVTIAMHPDRVARRRRMLTEETLRTALEETVQVLERTRRSFKSRELGAAAPAPDRAARAAGDRRTRQG